MAFDQPTRNRLQRFVADARTVLTAEFTRQLQNEYGLDPVAATVTPIEKLQYLDDARRETARGLRETLDHYKKTTPSESDRDLLDRIVREHAFTVLNRLAALRMAEARGLLIESLAQGYNSKGFQLYARLAGTGLGEKGDAYRGYLFSIFDEFALDLRSLFDRFAPASRLFPREAALLEVLMLMNDPEVAPLWAEDETIGWVYQYFNSKDERKKMRDESAAPRNSRELAVRNQFFTPRYVVEFLTDNTLGRIWYEMTKGETRLKEQCRYLVRRPIEIFLKPGEEPPASDEASTRDLSQEELLKQPVCIPHRPIKDPRSIRVLDPACGSMHFGLYAFDLLETIYDEAWELEASLGADALQREPEDASLWESYQDKAALLRDVPRLIIERNLHGIDIDPRAVQIAGLSLWLRAQRAWQQQGLKPTTRPQVRRSNIVCAEPMPGERELLEEFIEQHLSATPELRLIAQLVRRVFDSMKLAGEAGSLLKTEEEVAEAVAEAKEQWLADAQAEGEQGALFSDLAKHEQQRLGFQVSEITDESFWARAEGNIYAALQAYAEEAENGNGYQRRLFAEDAARGFAFIDLCRNRYDVVLMNPPFGLSQGELYSHLNEHYKDAFIDLLATFITRGRALSPSGLLGAITSRACLYTKTLLDWRTRYLSGRIATLADLGLGILDGAMVETCAYVLSDSAAPEGVFFDAKSVNEKDAELVRSINQLTERKCGSLPTFIRTAEFFELIPEHRILYVLPREFWQRVNGLPRIEPINATIRAGLTTYDDIRFLRLRWEIEANEIGVGKTWVLISKGGSFSTFYNDIHLAVSWAKGGKEVGAYNEMHYGTDAQSRRGSAFYLRPAATYSRRTHSFSARALPQNCFFSDKGPAILPLKDSSPAYLLGLFNTDLFRGLIHIQSQFGCFETGILKLLPWSQPSEEAMKTVESLTQICWKAKAAFFRTDETDALFASPCFNSNSLITEILNSTIVVASHANKLIRDTTYEINVQATKIYRLSTEGFEDLDVFADDHEIKATNEEALDLKTVGATILSYALGSAFGRWDITFATLKKPAPELSDPFAPLPVCPPGMLQNEQGLPAKPSEVPADYPLRISWPGILVDDTGHAQDIERRVREVLYVIWQDRADAIDQDACEIIGVKTIRDYFRKPVGFFADHLQRYSKSRRQAPIYWPLSTRSGEYTLWIYYHRLNDQTLYTCINEFIEPKLKNDITPTLDALRAKGVGRSRDEEKEFERLQDLEVELQDFRDELLRLAKSPWRPNLNDGVQITAAPLWKLFRLPKWQKTLKETWQTLEKGEYDWAHLAMTIWPERVVPKCTKDRSLAIAHEVEDLFWVEEDGKWRALKSPKQEVEGQIRRHRSEARDRIRQLLVELAASETGRLSADDVGHRLASGGFDDLELALRLDPQRMAEKCWEEPVRAERLGLKLPAKKTKAARDKFIKEIVAQGCADLAPMVKAALSGRALPFAECWKELVEGRQDGLPLALALWPDRVISKCAEDLAVAEAHDLRKFFWVQNPTETWRRRETQDVEIANEAARRRKP